MNKSNEVPIRADATSRPIGVKKETQQIKNGRPMKAHRGGSTLMYGGVQHEDHNGSPKSWV